MVMFSDRTIFEIKFGKLYEESGNPYVDESSSGPQAITTSTWMSSADWIFNGDLSGISSFAIISTNGNVVAIGSPGTSEGQIALNLYKQ